MKILIAILIFSAIILFHEFGHFLLAKLNGIVVIEFSLGMGPRLLSKTIRGTRYSLKAFPIGGSCLMLGEDTAEEKLSGSFNAAPVWGRISVVAAGPVFNFILALVLSVIIVACIGYEPALVSYVEEGSSAEAAGLMEDDLILTYQGRKIDLGKDLYVYSYMYPLTEDPISMTVLRDGEKVDITFTPDANVRYLLGFNRSTENYETGAMVVESLIEGMPLENAGVQPGDVITGINGVRVSNGQEYDAYVAENPLKEEAVDITFVRDGLEYDIRIVPAEYRTPKSGFYYNVGCVPVHGAGEVVRYALVEMKYMVRTTLISLRELFTGRVGVEELSGPVGVVDAIGETYEESKSEGWLMVVMNLLNMAVLLSANLGIMNLLPLPALDGGRLVFLILESIRRKPVNRELEATIHLAGLLLLFGLMIFIMYHDIIKLF